MSMQVNALSSHSTSIVPDVPIAISFREWLSGEHKINKYSHELATVGGKHLAERLGSSLLDPEGDLTLNRVGTQWHFPAVFV